MTTRLELSLADFLFSDAASPAEAPADFTAWMRENRRYTSLLEPRMRGAAAPRVTIDRAGTTREVVNLSSYNYLGLAHHPEVIEAAAAALRRYGAGACGSPLLSGMADLHRELETRLAAFLGREDCMLFNGGYVGGMGSLSGMLRRGDVGVLDAKCHLCLIDGVRLAGARAVFFDHDDPESLDRALASADGRRRLVVVEGVYSMDGDAADLARLVPVAERHGAAVFVDEAHSMLVHGEHGRGVLEATGMEDRVALRFATFSKAFGGVGSFVAGPRDLLEYLRFYARPYGFSCALPPATVAGLLAALNVATRDDALRSRLWENVAYFRREARAIGLDLGDSTSQVVPILVGSDRRRLYETCLEMHEKGLFLAPVDYPSVPEDGLRYRAAVTAAHTKEDLDRALDILDATVVHRATR